MPAWVKKHCWGSTDSTGSRWKPTGSKQEEACPFSLFHSCSPPQEFAIDKTGKTEMWLQWEKVTLKWKKLADPAQSSD